MFIDHRPHHEGYLIGRTLGRLPPKSRLRNGKSIRPYSEDVRKRQRALEGTSTLAIAFTCRQIYLEAAPIYYGGTIWLFRYKQWLELILETLWPKNKIQGIGSQLLEAVRHIRIQLDSPRMMALAVRFPYLKRLDVFNEMPGQQERVLSKILEKTVPALCPQQTPFLESLNYGSRYNKDFPTVLWSRADENHGLKKMKDHYYFHTPQQLRRFGEGIGQEMRDSIQRIHVQLDDSTMADELLGFKKMVSIRLLGNVRGAMQASTFDTLRHKPGSIRAGLPSLRDLKMHGPRNSTDFLSSKEFVKFFSDEATRTQHNTCDMSRDESSREPTPAAWDSS